VLGPEACAAGNQCGLQNLGLMVSVGLCSLQLVVASAAPPWITGDSDGRIMLRLGSDPTPTQDCYLASALSGNGDQRGLEWMFYGQKKNAVLELANQVMATPSPYPQSGLPL